MSQTHNQDAYGYKIYCDFGEDVSASSAFTMTIVPQRGDEISATPSIEASDNTLGERTFEANKHVSYTVPSGKFDDHVGRYRVMATALVGSEMKVTKWQYFKVTEGAE